MGPENQAVNSTNQKPIKSVNQKTNIRIRQKLIIHALLFGKSDDNNGSSNGIQIVIVILSCVFGVPFLLLLFFSILSIIKMCRSNPRHHPQNIQFSSNTPPQQIYPQEVINLQNYNMDEQGPFHINPKEQCPICIDQKVNLRTYCGHYYHPECLKGWMVRAKNRCPVCQGHKLNPMKVYCTKCFTGSKLVVLHWNSEDTLMNEISFLICADCKKQRPSFIDEHENVGQEISQSLDPKQQSSQKPNKPSESSAQNQVSEPNPQIDEQAGARTA